MSTTPPNTYLVTVEASAGGPDEKLRARLGTIAAFRLGRLDARTGHYPVAGGAFDMLDCLDGKFLWEMSDAELEARPPTRIDFEVVAVDPVARPATPGTVKVIVRVPR